MHKQTQPGSNLEITSEHMGPRSCLSERCRLRPLLSPSPRLFQDETKQTVRPTSVEHLFPVKSDFRHQLQHDSLVRGTELRGTSPASSFFF